MGLAALALSISNAPTARAAAINGVTVTTNLGGTGVLNNIINNSGLSTPVGLTSTHAGTSNTNAYTGQLTTTNSNITFNLNGTYNLAGFSFWARQLGSTLKTATIQSSTDGVTFANIDSGLFTFANVSLIPIPAQQFTFNSPVTAAYVRFLPLTNFFPTNNGILNTTTNNLVSLAEVKFNSVDATSVPEPLTILGTLTGLGCAIKLKRRLGGMKSQSES